MEHTKNIDSDDEMKLQDEFKKHQEFIVNLDAESLIERLVNDLKNLHHRFLILSCY